MSFLNHFLIVEEPRKDINVKHLLVDVLFLVFSAVISGAQGWKDIKTCGDTKLEWLRAVPAIQ